MKKLFNIAQKNSGERERAKINYLIREMIFCVVFSGLSQKLFFLFAAV
jgi:hypothetical protein